MESDSDDTINGYCNESHAGDIQSSSCRLISQFLPEQCALIQYTLQAQEGRDHYMAYVTTYDSDEYAYSWDVGLQEVVDNHIHDFAKLMRSMFLRRCKSRESGHSLSRLLLGPLLQIEDWQHLYVVPHGKLSMITLADLPGVIDWHTSTSYLHSVDDLWTMHQARMISVCGASRVVSASGCEGLPILPGSIEEGSAIYEMCKYATPNGVELFSGEAANRSAIVSAKAPLLLHFSGHTGPMDEKPAFEHLARLLQEIRAAQGTLEEGWAVATDDREDFMEDEEEYEMVQEWVTTDELFYDQEWAASIIRTLQALPADSAGILESIGLPPSSGPRVVPAVRGRPASSEHCHLEDTLAQLDVAREAYEENKNLMAKTGMFLSDGRLTSHEVSALDAFRGTQLVTLSTCQGMSVPQHGEATSGLGRAFSLAGSRSVLLNLYRIGDGETVTFMRAFYGNLLDGLGRAKALQLAQREFRGCGKGWILYGDVGPLFMPGSPRSFVGLEMSHRTSQLKELVYNLQEMRIRWQILCSLSSKHSTYTDHACHVKFEQYLTNKFLRYCHESFLSRVDRESMFAKPLYLASLEHLDQVIRQLKKILANSHDNSDLDEVPSVDQNTNSDVEDKSSSRKAPTTLFSAPAYQIPRQCIPCDMELLQANLQAMPVESLGQNMELCCLSHTTGADRIGRVTQLHQHRYMERMLVALRFDGTPVPLHFTPEHPVLCFLSGELHRVPAKEITDGTLVLTSLGSLPVKVQMEKHRRKVCEFQLQDPSLAVFAGRSDIYVATFGSSEGTVTVSNTFIDVLGPPISPPRRCFSAPPRFVSSHPRPIVDGCSETTGSSGLSSSSRASGNAQIILGPGHSSICRVSQLREVPTVSAGRRSSFGSAGHFDSRCIVCIYEQRKVGSCRFGLFCDRCHSHTRKRPKRHQQSK